MWYPNCILGLTVRNKIAVYNIHRYRKFDGVYRLSSGAKEKGRRNDPPSLVSLDYFPTTNLRKFFIIYATSARVESSEGLNLL